MGNHVGTGLVQLEKIGSVIADKGEMGGGDYLLRPDGPPFRTDTPRLPRQHPGILINRQVLCNSGQEFQRVELGLPGKLYRPGHREGQRRLPDQNSRRAGPGQGFQLLFQRLMVGQGVDKAVPLLKIAAGFPAQCPIPLQGRLLSLPVEPGGFRAEFPEQPPVNQSVLGGNFPGGASGGSAADASRFHHGAVCSGPLQHPGA